jgi:hypothetical protein
VKHLPAWFPGASFQRKAAVWKEIIVDSVDFPFSLLKARMVSLPLRHVCLVADPFSPVERWHSTSVFLFYPTAGIGPGNGNLRH